MKGIILAAGQGTRLYPVTLTVSKPLLPVYDKPLIYYSMAVLMQAGIREILVIVPPGETSEFSDLLGNGKQIGVSIDYLEQKEQRGIADAFIIGRDFIADDNVTLVLGDNIFFGPGFRHKLRNVVRKQAEGATIFGYYVSDPRPFGVVEFDKCGKAISIEEKPISPKSNFIVPGLYIYDNKVIDIADTLDLSERGELEITAVNNEYLKMGKLNVVQLDEEYTWFDAGTADNLYYASGKIKEAQRSGKMIACLEEIAARNHWITEAELHKAAKKMENTRYGEYIARLIEDDWAI